MDGIEAELILKLEIDFGPLEDNVNDIRISNRDGIRYWAISKFITDVEVAFVSKNLEQVFIARLNSYMNRCLFVVVADVWICSLLQQELYYINMTPTNVILNQK